LASEEVDAAFWGGVVGIDLGGWSGGERGRERGGKREVDAVFWGGVVGIDLGRWLGGERR
jgi:hypothetical protein